MSDYQRFRAGFAEAMDPAFHTIEELDAKLASGAALLWGGSQAAIVTEIQQFPGAVVIHGLCATGDLREIVEQLIPAAEKWARLAGCTHAMIESREGWKRALKERGYEPHTVTLRKEL